MARKPSPKPSPKPKPKREKINPGSLSIADLDKMRALVDSYFEPYIPKPSALAKGIVGRPPRYDRAFCAVLIEDAALGHTLGGTAALIGVNRATLNDWAASHPEFGEALARAKAVRQRFYEGHLIDIARRGGDSTRFSAVKHGLINVGADDWKERLTAEHNVTFNLGSLIAESMKLAGPVIEGNLIEQPKRDPTEPQD